jgi:cytochrome c5
MKHGRFVPALLVPALLLAATDSPSARGADNARKGSAVGTTTVAQLDRQFDSTARPFLQTYCVSCHSGAKPPADLNLGAFASTADVLKDGHRVRAVLDRLKAEEMPPRAARAQPSADARRAAIEWFQSAHDYDIHRNAGDPGVVLARRLSNAEYDYTIRDLTGVDIRPTREFPVDPSNTAGFDNSGESLVMSPALLKKYLAAARDVASHMFLQPKGFSFAPHPMLSETDREKYYVQQIIDLYHRQNLDYADYFQAAWFFKHRVALGKPRATLADIATAQKVSPKYLGTVWATLEGTKEDVGPVARLQAMWRELPAPSRNQPEAARPGAEHMRDFVVQLRKKIEPRFWNLAAGKLDAREEPFLIWKDQQYATHRRSFDPDQLQIDGAVRPLKPELLLPEPGSQGQFGPGHTVLVKNTPGDADLLVPAAQLARYEAAFAKFASVFPDMFYMEERGRNYFDTTKDRGRYLSAGFHNMMGYFRDDLPLYELVLDTAQQKQLDALWFDLDFVANVSSRTYIQYYLFARDARALMEAGRPGGSQPPDEEITASETMAKLEGIYLTIGKGGSDVALQAVKDYFKWADTTIHAVEKARRDAEPSHLDALLHFAARAYRRPLTAEDKQDLLAQYRNYRDKDGLDHEAAIRESLVGVLMSPELCYRVDLLDSAKAIRPLSDYELASRLSYFLWSSLPDKELLAHAAAGDLHNPRILTAQARRMLKDPRIRGLAVEFGGNWLDFRRFEDIASVDRTRFASFTNELRDAMFEEPARFLTDVFQTNRSVLDLLYATDTFVNPVLAKHYGIPIAATQPNEWVHVPDATAYGRGGLLPMAAFLTKNAPGLRTSPVKRGNWVVRNMLGERIPPPPPVVPELPNDEAKLDLPLREMLARHRANPMCASCHARFDSFGLVFEGFGPVGERREKDLAGHAVDVAATFPGGKEAAGVAGLQQYIRERRQDNFLDNVFGRLLAYALGRSLITSDEATIQDMHAKLAATGYRFDSLIESIVTSRQFLYKRGQEDLAQR